ncbi:phytoene/squalene synthase family protein [Pseudoxanthomonas sp. UTMC 1351]|uniref:phytoene/squalene synthase family protein n=1 Tax=Pseudoxanthomonas sp. UTMC 1351 TaxID=2695853 RepID=UPI0034CFE047
MSDSTALDSFLDKWRARWPEWQMAEVFVPLARRPVAVAWFALLQEFEDIMNISGDPLPADAKLAWWGEELRDWSRQRSRHPLGRVLEPQPAPWAALAETLPQLIAARDRPADATAAFAGLQSFGEAVAVAEAALFTAPASALLAEAITAQMLATRLAEAGTAALPLREQKVAEAGDLRAQSRQWAEILLRHWPERQGGRERRLLSAMARGRLRRFAKLGEAAPMPSPAVLLFNAWRAARGG